MVYQFMPHSGSNSAAQQWWASVSPLKTPQAPPVLPNTSSTVPDFRSSISFPSEGVSKWRLAPRPSFLVLELLGNCVLDWDFNTLKFSVIDGQPKELQQLLAVFVDEVGRLLPALILQLRVGAQWQKVAAADRVQATVLTQQGWVSEVGRRSRCVQRFSFRRGQRCKNVADSAASLTCVLALTSARVCW